MATKDNMLQPVKPRTQSTQTILWKEKVTVNSLPFMGVKHYSMLQSIQTVLLSGH